MNKSTNKETPGDLLARPWFWVAVFAAVAVLAVLGFFLIRGIIRQDTPPSPTEQTGPSNGPAIDVTDTEAVELGQGLVITDIGKYSGRYMEDGSNEAVTDVMMLIVENTSEKDLQLARIHMDYEGFTASFQITNVPAGDSVLVLEHSRHAAVDQKYQYLETENVVFFDEPMSLRDDFLELSIGDQYIEVRNKSDIPISGDIYVYYKNSSADLLYGGITYRVKIEGGLAPQQSKVANAGHFDPENSRLMMVTFAED